MSEMIYGIHAVQALLERAPERFQDVFILKGREDKRLLPLIHALEAQGVVIQLANRQFLDEKSEGAVHQGIIARVKPGRQYQENDLPDLIALHDRPFLLILDGVTDPHNLGACLRSADAAGVHAVIVPKDRRNNHIYQLDSQKRLIFNHTLSPEKSSNYILLDALFSNNISCRHLAHHTS